MFRTILILLTCFLTFQLSFTQEDGNYYYFLARQFAENGEYQKAADYYADLFNEEDGLQYYDDYLMVLSKLKNPEAVEKLIKAAYKKAQNNPVYLIDLGKFYQQQNRSNEAQKQFDKIIKELPKDQFQIKKIATYFEQKNLIDEAKRTYLKGKELLKNANAFNLEIANLHLYNNDYKSTVLAYLDEAPTLADNLVVIQNGLLKVIQKDETIKDFIESNLYQRIGKDKTLLVYQDLLVWFYTQNNDFDAAITQAKSLDMLRNEDGRGVSIVSTTAMQQKDYDAAIKGFQYLITKGKNNPWYYTASLYLINAQREKLINQTKFKPEELQNLKTNYLNFINANPDNQIVNDAIVELANLEALYLHDITSAISRLEPMVKLDRLPKETLSKAKLNLGDYYLIDGNPWDARLLYTQVEKDQKGTALGEDAKYRNARLSYFKGDFEWAQTQLKIIKANTSELISNDAIDLSVFILDNLNTDETDVNLLTFSKAQLLVFQNKLDEANDTLIQLTQNASQSALLDDIYFEQYKIERKQQNYEAALQYLLKIENDFSTDILADDAVFYAAELYQMFLNNDEKAKAYYEKIIVDYKDSTYVIEARKRYRKLRGDI